MHPSPVAREMTQGNPRLFVGNLAEEVGDDDLRALFAVHGGIVEAQVIRDRDSGESRGFGFIQMATDAQAAAALAALHGTEFRGKRLRVKVAEPKKGGGFHVPNTQPEGQAPGAEAAALTPPPRTPMPLPPPTPAAAALPQPPPAPKRAWLPAVAAVSLLAVLAGAWVVLRPARAAPGHVLIVPLDVMGQPHGGEYVGYALSQALAVNLATAASLKVLPVPGTAEVAGLGATQRAQLALKAGAGRLVVGTLTRVDSGVHVSLTLVDAQDNRILWGTQRDARGADDVALAGSLARELAAQLGGAVPELVDHVLNLSGGPVMATAPETAEALGALRRGEVQAALAATERLRAQFPQEVDAVALRTHALLLQWDAARSPATSNQFRESLERLEQAAPGSPYAEFYRAYILYESGRNDEAVTRFSRILDGHRLSPAARAWVLRYRAIGHQRLGKLPVALDELAESQRLDPTNAWTLSILAEVLLQAGQAEQALARARQGVALAPGYWRGHHGVGEALSALGRLDEAAEAFGRECELAHTQLACSRWAVELLKAGKREAAAQAADDAARLPETAVGLYNLGCFRALSGDGAGALERLARAVDLGLVEPGMGQDRDLATVRDDPRFKALWATVAARSRPSGDAGR